MGQKCKLLYVQKASAFGEVRRQIPCQSLAHGAQWGTSDLSAPLAIEVVMSRIASVYSRVLVPMSAAHQTPGGPEIRAKRDI